MQLSKKRKQSIETQLAYPSFRCVGNAAATGGGCTLDDLETQWLALNGESETARQSVRLCPMRASRKREKQRGFPATMCYPTPGGCEGATVQPHINAEGPAAEHVRGLCQALKQIPDIAG